MTTDLTRPEVHGLFDPATWTVTYVVHSGPGSACAIVDSVLDYDPKSGRTRHESADRVIDYVQALLTRSRQHPGVRVGLSPRAGIALLRAARAYALLLGRMHVLPDDVQALFAAVAAHRLVPEAEAASAGALAKAILHAVPVD